MQRISRLRGPGGPELFALDREPREIAPGAVHIPDWLSLAEQIELVGACRSWARGEHRMVHQVLAGGGVMSVRSTVLGRGWSRAWHEGQGAGAGRQGHEPRGEEGEGLLPEALSALGPRALRAAYGERAPEVQDGPPTTALINYYDADATMGMHQDLDESGPHPIISLSLGDACVFRFGSSEGRGQPYQDVELRSGDLFVFGRESRWAFHGVPAVRPGTGDPRLGMRSGGRLNITLRRTDPVARGRRIAERSSGEAVEHGA